MIKLFIAGDVVPKGIMPEDFKANRERIFGPVKPFINNADFSVVNLEAPIIRGEKTPIQKSGPCLGVAASTVNVLKDVGFNVFTLANNHFFDQGQMGVEATIETCLAQAVNIVGGGKTEENARIPLILENDGKSVAIINACEHEFSIASKDHGGSNALDLIKMQEDIANARSKADHLVLILHGGIEHYQYPTPRMKRWYRHFVDLGADAVINHHQHCINGYEVYKSKPIFYGLGNFYFPWGSQSRPDSWNYGYAVNIFIDEEIGFELIPYKQTTEGVALRDKYEFEKEIETLNYYIKDDNQLLFKFEDYVNDYKYRILMGLLPSFMRCRFIEAIVRRGWLGTLYYGLDRYNVRNKLICESHQELLQGVFTKMTK